MRCWSWVNLWCLSTRTRVIHLSPFRVAAAPPGQSPLATTGVSPWMAMIPVDTLSSNLDDSALYLVWYARARRNRLLKPLRTIALPQSLLDKHWVQELNHLIEEKVVPYEEFVGRQSETETTECRAVVLYRPVLRAMRFWETWVLTFAPIIGTIGILWTSSRVK